MDGVSRRHDRRLHSGGGGGAFRSAQPFSPTLAFRASRCCRTTYSESPPSWVILILNAFLMIWAWKELSPRFVMWTMWAVLLFSLLLKLFEFVPVPVIGDKFLAAMVSGVLRGLGAGLVFRVGGSTGGLDIPGVALRKRYGIEMGQFSIYINMGLLGLSFFGRRPGCGHLRRGGAVCLRDRRRQHDALVRPQKTGIHHHEYPRGSFGVHQPLAAPRNDPF